MFRQLFALTLSVACVAVEAAGSSVIPTYGHQDWFGASVSDGVVAAVGGKFSDGGYVPVGDKIAIDSDLEQPASFVVDDGNVMTTKLASVAFNMDVATIPNDKLSTSFGEAKVGFAVYETAAGAATNFVAWVGGQDWITLTGAEVPPYGGSFSLVMTFDKTDSASPKVQFKVGETVLKSAGGEEWFVCGGFPELPQFDFVGTGKLKKIAADQMSVVSELVIVSGGAIHVSDEDFQAFAKLIEGTAFESVGDLLAAEAKTVFGGGTKFAPSLTVAEAFAVGLVKKGNDGNMAPVDDGEIRVRADAQAKVADGIPVALNVNPPADTGATITYRLMGSTDGVGYSAIDGVAAVSDAADLKIPTEKVGSGEGKFRFFKITTAVSLIPENE